MLEPFSVRKKEIAAFLTSEFQFDRETVETIAAEYLADALGSLSAMTESFAREEFDSLSEQAHFLKGVAAGAGDSLVSILAEELGKAAACRVGTECSVILEQLNGAFHEKN